MLSARIPLLRIAIAWSCLAASFVICDQFPETAFHALPSSVSLAIGSAVWSCALAIAIYLLRRVSHVHPRSIAGGAIVVFAVAAAVMYGDAPLAIDGATRAMAGILIGALMALLVDQLFFLVPAALLAAAVDVWSVFAERGVTHKLYASTIASSTAPDSSSAAATNAVAHTVQTTSAHGANVADIIAIPIPLIGGQAPVTLGFVDIAFATCFVVMACSFRVHSGRTAIAVAVGISATIGLASLNGGLPALPLIGILAIAANAPLLLRDRRYVMHRLRRQVE